MEQWILRTRSLSIKRPKIMGILNVTPDSFSDGGLYLQAEDAIAHAHAMVQAGADLIDVGAESSRPGAVALSPELEWQRLEPVLRKLTKELRVPISVDTRHGSVAARALSIGVEIINDISGGEDAQLLDCVASSDAAYILMHIRGNAETMMSLANYKDLVPEVISELQDGLNKVRAKGINNEKICIDPGFGFAKTPKQNYELLERLTELSVLEKPILVGLSRKRMLIELVGDDSERVKAASVAVAMIAQEKGASILRVHDVKETKDVLQSLNRN